MCWFQIQRFQNWCSLNLLFVLALRIWAMWRSNTTNCFHFAMPLARAKLCHMLLGCFVQKFLDEFFPSHSSGWNYLQAPSKHFQTFQGFPAVHQLNGSNSKQPQNNRSTPPSPGQSQWDRLRVAQSPIKRGPGITMTISISEKYIFVIIEE